MQLSLLQDEPAPAAVKPSAPSRKRIASAVGTQSDQSPDAKSPDAFKNISEAASLLEVPQHVLRFWESRFTQIKPLKMAGGRRYYRPEDMDILVTIKNLLYKQGYTIEGAKKAFGLLRGRKHAEPKKPLLEKPRMTDKKRNQIAVIRQELMGLRETLQGYL